MPNPTDPVQPSAQPAASNVGAPAQPPAQPAASNVGAPSQPPAQVAVPDVVGLTQSAAQERLKSANLMVGAVKTHDSNTVPAGGISDTNPDAGTLVSPGSEVELDISNGPKSNWTQYVPTALFMLLGLTVLGLIVYAITQSDQAFLSSLADKERARGLITFLIAISTVGVAIILSISTLILAAGDDGDKRFDRGKQVLSVLIGVLGTIVGFYFGAETKPTTEQTQTLSYITTSKLPDGTVNQPYTPTTLKTTGLLPPLKWLDPGLPPGLAWDSATGTISGTPTAQATKKQYTFTVTDSATPPVTDTKKLDLEIK
ncbi:MAG TPA: PASTA domain-containing protein [Candidatus Polarisedimenticolia bacterium]|nr:PASTA domain-containing protein [Candidatus Polarisedimenticolia bacterium]